MLIYNNLKNLSYFSSLSLKSKIKRAYILPLNKLIIKIFNYI